MLYEKKIFIIFPKIYRRENDARFRAHEAVYNIISIDILDVWPAPTKSVPKHGTRYGWYHINNIMYSPCSKCRWPILEQCAERCITPTGRRPRRTVDREGPSGTHARFSARCVRGRRADSYGRGSARRRVGPLQINRLGAHRHVLLLQCPAKTRERPVYLTAGSVPVGHARTSAGVT